MWFGLCKVPPRTSTITARARNENLSRYKTQAFSSGFSLELVPSTQYVLYWCVTQAPSTMLSSCVRRLLSRGHDKRYSAHSTALDHGDGIYIKCNNSTNATSNLSIWTPPTRLEPKKRIHNPSVLSSPSSTSLLPPLFHSIMLLHNFSSRPTPLPYHDFFCRT